MLHAMGMHADPPEVLPFSLILKFASYKISVTNKQFRLDTIEIAQASNRRVMT